MIRWGRTFFAGLAIFAVAACAKPPLATVSEPERDLIAISLMRDIAVLASDEYGGRRPGTPGEERTVTYLIEEMQAAGLVSGTNDPGSAWRAPVPLVSSQALDSRIILRTAAGEFTLPDESAAAFSDSRRALIDGTGVVFVGKESESVDPAMIAGNVVVMLGEPGVSPRRRATLFEADPAAIVTVVEDQENIANVRLTFGRERLELTSEINTQISAFVTNEMMAQAWPGGAWSSLVEQANGEGFEPRPLEATIAIDLRTARREFISSNVIGMLPGSVPGSGAVFLMSHWDHLGQCGDEASGDLICNGAIDNASGLAVMLELARRLKASGPHERDIYFLATSAEEAGLLGARAFLEQPPLPLESIVAVFNFDTVAVAPAGSPVGFVGEGRTELDTIILQVMEESERQLGDRDFAEQFVRRQDGWVMLEQGIPAVFLSTAFGSEIVIGPYLAEDYHRPSDQIEKIELGGAIDDLLLHEELIKRIANTALYPTP